MTKIFLVFLFLFSYFNGSSQEAAIQMDAIDSVIANPQLTETEKVREVLEQVKKNVSSFEIGNQQLKKMLVLAEKNHLDDEKFQTLTAITRFSMFMQEFDSVYYYGNASIDFLKERQRTRQIGEPLGYIMSAYYYQDRYEDAIDFFNLNRHYFEGEDEFGTLSNVYYAASINFEQLDEIDSTLFYMEKAVSITDPEVLFDQYLNLSGVLLAMYSEYGRKTDANQVISEILERKKHIVDSVNLMSINNSLGQHYQYNGELKKAKKYFLEALTVSINKGFATETATTYFNIYMVEKEMGDFESALTTFENYTAVQDSINNIEIKIASQEFEEKYENDKLVLENLKKEARLREEENIRMRAEAATIRSKRNLLVVVIFSVLLAVIAAFWIITIRNSRKKEALKAQLVKEEIERDLAENQLKVFRSQMNPHFVFNAINSIQELIIREDTTLSYNYLVEFSKLLRNTLEYSKQEFITVAEETEYLNLYLSLEKLRFNDEFTYSIENRVSDDVLVPSIILQPFVENAIKHGLFHKKGLKNLKIAFYKTDHLMCEITDNGVGRVKAEEIKKRRNRKHNSFSTEAIANRMKILSQKYNGDVHYEIEDLYEGNEPRGTRVLIHLPDAF